MGFTGELKEVSGIKEQHPHLDPLLEGEEEDRGM